MLDILVCVCVWLLAFILFLRSILGIIVQNVAGRLHLVQMEKSIEFRLQQLTTTIKRSNSQQQQKHQTKEKKNRCDLC